MKSFPLVFSLIVLCQTDMFGQVNEADKNKIILEKSESSYWRESIEDFQKINLLHAVLSHCNQDNIIKNTGINFPCEYIYLDDSNTEFLLDEIKKAWEE